MKKVGTRDRFQRYRFGTYIGSKQSSIAAPAMTGRTHKLGKARSKEINKLLCMSKERDV